MIYAEITDARRYVDLHHELLAYVEQHFVRVEHGLQGDAYIWIYQREERVALDTFTSTRFQLKSASRDAAFIESVVATLEKRYPVRRYDEPEREPHE